MIPLPAAYSSSRDIASKTRLLLFSEAGGRLPNNCNFFFLKKQHYLEKNEVNPIFLLVWDWWTKMAWRAGRHQTDWTSSGFCYFTSKQCGRCDFHFNLSDYLIFLSAITPPAALIFYLWMCLCNHVTLISGLTVNKHCLCGRNYQARSTDMNCYIIYISVTTMHSPNLEFWQMVFLFEMFFISSTLYPKLIFHHPVILGCRCCAGDEMNVGFHLKPINKWIELNKIK